MNYDQNSNQRQFLSIKARLLILLIVMILPFIGFSAYKAFQIKSSLEQEAQKQSLSTAQNIAHEVDEYILSTGDVLIAVATNEAMKTQNYAEAKPWLNEMLTKYPFYHLFAFVDLKGDVKVAVVSPIWARSEDVQKLLKTLNVSDTACYRRGIVSNGVSVGDFMYSKITGMPVVHVTYPVFDYSGKRIGFVAAAFDLTKIQNKLMQSKTSKHAVIAVVDDKGMIIARSIDPKRWVGKNYRHQMGFDAMLGKSEGIGKVTAPDGVVRLFAFAGTTQAPWYVRSGIDENYIHSQVKDQLMNHFEVFIPLLLLAILGWLWIGKDVDALYKETGWLTLIDPLTGLLNCRKLYSDLDREFSFAKRYKEKLSFIMLDIDDFKRYNDTNGHQAGDKTLRFVADAIKIAVRDIDLVYRYGGEEFCVILPKADKDGALLVAERVRECIECAHFDGEEQQPLGKLTVSAGVATYPDDSISKDGLVRCADAALYIAKESGRNKVEAYSKSDTISADKDIHTYGQCI